MLTPNSAFQAHYSLKVRKQKLRKNGVIEIIQNSPVHFRVTLH